MKDLSIVLRYKQELACCSLLRVREPARQVWWVRIYFNSTSIVQFSAADVTVMYPSFNAFSKTANSKEGPTLFANSYYGARWYEDV